MTDELKPCPFCGSDDVLVSEPGAPVYCKPCGARAISFDAWQSRPQPAPKDGMGDELISRIKHDLEYAESFDAHLDEGGTYKNRNVRDLIKMVKRDAAAALRSNPADGMGEALTNPWPTKCDEGPGHCCCGCETCCDCYSPKEITPNWENAEVCLENAILSYDQQSICDGNGPVDTTISSGDLNVIISLAGAAIQAKAVLAKLEKRGG